MSVAARRTTADRIALFVLAAIILPGLAAAGWDVWYEIAQPDSGGHGEILLIYGMYAVGVIIWSGLRLMLQRPGALIFAVTIFFLGLPFVAALASLGPLAFFLLAVGLGGIVASLTAPGRTASA